MLQGINRRTRLLSGVAFGAAALMAVGSAQAQTAPAQSDQTTDVGDVVVTGIRRSIEASIAAKARTPRSSKSFRLKTSASCRTCRSLNPWRACLA